MLSSLFKVTHSSVESNTLRLVGFNLLAGSVGSGPDMLGTDHQCFKGGSPAAKGCPKLNELTNEIALICKSFLGCACFYMELITT